VEKAISAAVATSDYQRKVRAANNVRQRAVTIAAAFPRRVF